MCEYIALLITLVINEIYDLQIHQMNVKRTFLNVESEEEIYMKQPEDFVVPGK